MDGPKVVREKRAAQATVQVVQDPFPERRPGLSKRAERHGLHPQRVVLERRPPLVSAPRHAGRLQPVAAPLEGFQGGRWPNWVFSSR